MNYRPEMIFALPFSADMRPECHLAPSTRKLLEDVADVKQIPINLSMSGYLGALSMTFAPHYKVQTPLGAVSPLALFLLDVAEPGEGKGPARDVYQKPQREADEKQSDPSKRVIRSHFTKSGLIKALQHSKALALMLREGGTLLDDNVLELLAYLCQGWSGEGISILNGNAIYECDDPRLTIDIPAQPSPIFGPDRERVLNTLRRLGFLARCLTQVPRPIAGSRIFKQRDGVGPVVEKYWTDLAHTLDKLAERDGKPSELLQFDEIASARWVDYANRIEQLVQDGQFLCDMRDVAAKTMSNVSRIAALLHLHRGDTGLIHLEYLEQAWAIAWYYLHQFKRCFAILPHEYDAKAIERYLNGLRLTGYWAFKRSAIYNNGPIRNDKKRFGRAIDHLISAGIIYITHAERNMVTINLNVEHFSRLPSFY